MRSLFLLVFVWLLVLAFRARPTPRVPWWQHWERLKRGKRGAS